MLAGMRLGWRLFARQMRGRSALEPDSRALDKQSLLMAAVIVASSVALLATTEEPTSVSPGGGQTASTYSFERTDIDGGSVDLTTDEPRVTYYINVEATALGPDNVLTTTSASATLEGTVTTSGLNAAGATPSVSFRASSAGLMPMQVDATDRYFQGAVLAFSGNCADPTHGQACRAQLALEMARADDGASGGTVHVDWHFSVQSSGSVPSASAKMVGPLDPPWQIEVIR